MVRRHHWTEQSSNHIHFVLYLVVLVTLSCNNDTKVNFLPSHAPVRIIMFLSSVHFIGRKPNVSFFSIFPYHTVPYFAVTAWLQYCGICHSKHKRLKRQTHIVNGTVCQDRPRLWYMIHFRNCLWHLHKLMSLNEYYGQNL